MTIKIKQPKPTVLRINRLRGRILNLPAPKGKRREILVIYGLHSSIESVTGLARVINKYGAVTVPELPGIGGMTSFHSIDEAVLVDNYASYLASLIEFRYHRKRNIAIVAVGEGALFVTRMLQNHTKAANKIDKLICIGGILHHNDVPTLRSNRILARLAYSFLLLKPITWIVSRFRFRWLIKATHTHKNRPQELREVDVKVWQKSDMRTHFTLKRQFLRVDACTTTLDRAVFLVCANLPSGVDTRALKQHASIVFKRVNEFVPKHTITGWYDLYNQEQVAKNIGSKLKTWLQ